MFLSDPVRIRGRTAGVTAWAAWGGIIGVSRLAGCQCEGSGNEQAGGAHEAGHGNLLGVQMIDCASGRGIPTLYLCRVETARKFPQSHPKRETYLKERYHAYDSSGGS
jgi:hypothetical protein